MRAEIANISLGSSSLRQIIVSTHKIYRVRQKKWTPEVFRCFLSNRLKF